MGYQTVRALVPIRHSGVLRVPGQTSGDNAQDFVAEDSQANRLVALGYATSLGVASDPTAVTPEGGASSKSTGLASLRRMFGTTKYVSFAQQRHILRAQAWTAKTYRKGEVVRNTVGGVEHMWIVLGDNLVSTAAPTDTVSTKPIADPGDAASGTDTKGWVYIGPERLDPVLSAEVESYTTQTSLTVAGASWSGNAGGATSPLITRIGLDKLGAGSFFNVSSNMIYADQGQKDASYSLGGVANFTFYSDEAVLAWRVIDATQVYDYPVWVDDVPLSFGSVSTTINNNVRVLRFRNRRMRKIMIQSSGLSMIWATSANATFLPAEEEYAANWLQVVDSYGAGAAPGPAVAMGQWGCHIARELGLPMPSLNGLGGTGIVSTNGGTGYNFMQRLEAREAQIKARKFRFALLHCSGNDVGVGTLDEYRVQVRALLGKMRSVLAEGAPIFALSMANKDISSITLTGQGYQWFLAFNEVVTDFAASDKNTYLIPTSTDMTGAIPLMNPSMASLYIGATDRHPFDSGHQFYAEHTALAIRALVSAA